MDAPSAEITMLLKAWSGGDPAALERLAEQVYPELRLMARRCMKNERPGNTLQATALVHEVYLRLVDVTKVEWRERAQFFAMAAQMMRRILVNAANARASQKRGGTTPKVNIEETALLSAGAGPVHFGGGRGPDRFFAGGPTPGQGGRVAVFWRPDGRGDRCGPEHLAAHGQARLGFAKAWLSKELNR